MFEYLKGLLVSVSEEHAVLEVGGVGYRLHIPHSISCDPPGLRREALFYVSAIIREDSHRLFGFLTEDERTLFETLIELPGIGPKIALHLVGRIPYADLYSALIEKNVTLLSRIPGIGKKTAERLILELPSKLAPPAVTSVRSSSLTSDVLSTLSGLGYSFAAAQKAIRSVLDEHPSEPPLPQFIAAALKHLR